MLDGGEFLSGATVAVTISNGSTTRSGTGTTNTGGDVGFVWKNAPGGTYTTTIILVNGAGISDPNFTTYWDQGDVVCAP